MNIVRLMLLSRQMKNRRHEKNNTMNGIPPLTFNAIAGILKNYRIYGNTVDGESVSVGDKTDNILNFYDLVNSPTGKMPGLDDYTFDHVLQLNLKPNTYYTLSSDGYGSLNGEANKNRSLYFYEGITEYSVFNGHPVTIQTQSSGYVKIGFISSRPNAQQYISGEAVIMFNEGESVQPYEHYGHRIPVTVNAQTTNIYLNEPLTKSGNSADYIDYATQKRHNSDGTESSVTLPEIAVAVGTNTLTVGTEVQPSRVELMGRIKEAQINGSGNT